MSINLKTKNLTTNIFKCKKDNTIINLYAKISFKHVDFQIHRSRSVNFCETAQFEFLNHTNRIPNRLWPMRQTTNGRQHAFMPCHNHPLVQQTNFISVLLRSREGQRRYTRKCDFIAKIDIVQVIMDVNCCDWTTQLSIQWLLCGARFAEDTEFTFLLHTINVNLSHIDELCLHSMNFIRSCLNHESDIIHFIASYCF